MASNNIDEFVLNFDLNQFNPEENAQILKYDKIRKCTSWLKTKIMCTHNLIQQYHIEHDKYKKSANKLNIVSDNHKQSLITLEEATKRCKDLENQNEELLANQEVLKGQRIDAENKYEALLSHTNQLQMLVKELETAKEVLTVEKELAKCNNKHCSPEYKQLQNENDSMLKDLRVLKDVILGKKKANKRHVALIKKYERDKKLKTAKNECKSDESGDEINDCGDILPHTGIKLSEVSNETDTLNPEKKCINNYSNGEMSVDPGCGSSRANSHDKFISSPDYVVNLESPTKLPTKDVVKRVDAANSPITVYPYTSVATSPIMFDNSAHLFVTQREEYTDCTDDAEYIIDDIPLSEEISDLVQQEKLADCTSPVSHLSNIIGGGTSPNENYEVIIVKEADVSPSDNSLFTESIDPDETNAFKDGIVIEKQIPRCACEKSDTLTINGYIELIDACTSPLTIADDNRQYVNKGINTDKHDENVYVTKNHVNVGTNTDTEIQLENQMARKTEKSTNNIGLLENEMVDACTNTDLIPIEKSKVVDTGMDIVFMKQNKKSLLFDDQIPKTDTVSMFSSDKRCAKRNNTTINGTEELRNQERVCLESNSSKTLHFESTNDAEVQNILNVMTFHHNLISPLSKTPCDSEYLKMIPEMKNTLTKIWTYIANISKMPNQSRNIDINLQSSTNVNNFKDIPGVEINSSKRTSDQEEFRIDRATSQVVADETVERTSSTFIETSTRQVEDTDNTYLECPNIAINESPTDTMSQTTESDIFCDQLVSHYTTNKVSSTGDEKKKNQQQQQLANSPSDISYCHKTVETISTKDVNKEIDSQQQQILNYSMVNEICEDNLNNINITNNNCETSHITEAFISHTLIVNGTQTKRKSKLEKFREKLIPSCKIKKELRSNKHLSKTFVKPKNTTSSPSIKQKLAYENAVKVMAELRSRQQLQEKKKSQSLIPKTSLESKSSKSKSSVSESFEPNMLFTRSRTRRSSKKEEETAKPENTNDIEMSPSVNRRLRKRSADTEVDSLRNNSKRILRSSNVAQVTNGNVLQQVQSINMGDQLQNLRDNLNPEYNICPSDSAHSVGTKSDITLAKSIRLKPAIELSECLADNANVVSIVPGNVSYLDVKKNSNQTKKLPKLKSNKLSDKNNCSEVNQLILEKTNDAILTEKPVVSSNTNNYVTYGDKFTNTSQDQSSEINRMEAKNNDSVNEYSNNNQGNDDKRGYSNEQNSPKATGGATTTNHDITNSMEQKLREEANRVTKIPVVELIPLQNHVVITNKIITNGKNIVNYSDLDMYTGGSNTGDTTPNPPQNDTRSCKENILCTALDRYGVICVKHVAKKVPDAVTLMISQKIEESITNIIASSRSEQKSKMDDLVGSIQNFKVKHILAGLMRYLKDTTRKTELFSKIVNGLAPPMTKSEVVLLYVIESLNASFHGFINRLWNNMEHALFQLNRAPNFDVIESMSHFYAVLCRYFRSKSRLRCFMLDAMYCLQFKAVPLIRQCLDVCPRVLPNAHERMAKTSLVTCLVYLLHFYKCQDKYNRAQDIRNILYQKYQYKFSEWNETMILEIFRKAIMDLRGTQNDKKMLRVALIILCKRHGAKWCQFNIIQNILLPIIEKDVPDEIKQFCVLMLGPLLKPFPADRKAQCEIVINQLLQMLMQTNSQEMKEAIYSSLIFMNKHDPERVVQALLSWNPDSVSPEFEEILNDYVMEKPLAVWKKLVVGKHSKGS